MSSEETMQSPTILIVDDGHTSLSLLQPVLERAGYTSVFGVTDPRRAQELFRELQPDLVVLDLQLPVPDAVDLVHGLQTEIPTGSYLPILMVTADARSEMARRAHLCGVQHFLLRPLDAAHALDRVRSLLQARYRLLRLERESRPQQGARETRFATASLLRPANARLLTAYDV